MFVPFGGTQTWWPETNRNICHWVLLQKCISRGTQKQYSTIFSNARTVQMAKFLEISLGISHFLTSSWCFVKAHGSCFVKALCFRSQRKSKAPHTVNITLLPTSHPREDARVTRRQHYRAVCVSEFWYKARESRMQMWGNVRVTSSVIVFKLANGIAVFLSKPITSAGSWSVHVKVLTSLPEFYLFGLSIDLVASLLFPKATSCCVIRRNLK